MTGRSIFCFKYRVSQKDVYTRLIFRIIMRIHLFGIPCISKSLQTTLAADAHPAEGQILIKGSKFNIIIIIIPLREHECQMFEL
jgi:hypothetical protein